MSTESPEEIVDKELERLKVLTKKELAECASWLAKSTLKDLADIPQNPDSTVIQAMVAAVAARVITKGDSMAFDALMNRIVGKVKDELHVDEKSVKVVITLPSNAPPIENRKL